MLRVIGNGTELKIMFCVGLFFTMATLLID